eukprot:7093158-Alexandrium_andersonii.AAC.1
MQIRALHAPQRLRRPSLESGAPDFCGIRAAERALRPVGRVGTATSWAGFVAPASFDQRAG